MCFKAIVRNEETSGSLLHRLVPQRDEVIHTCFVCRLALVSWKCFLLFRISAALTSQTLTFLSWGTRTHWKDEGCECAASEPDNRLDRAAVDSNCCTAVSLLCIYATDVDTMAPLTRWDTIRSTLCWIAGLSGRTDLRMISGTCRDNHYAAQQKKIRNRHGGGERKQWWCWSHRQEICHKFDGRNDLWGNFKEPESKPSGKIPFVTFQDAICFYMISSLFCRQQNSGSHLFSMQFLARRKMKVPLWSLLKTSFFWWNPCLPPWRVSHHRKR